MFVECLLFGRKKTVVFTSIDSRLCLFDGLNGLFKKYVDGL